MKRYKVELDGSKCVSYTLVNRKYMPNRHIIIEEKNIKKFRDASVFLIYKLEDKPVVETKPENKPEGSPEGKPEGKPETKPEEKPENKPEGKPENKSGKPSGVITSGDLKK